jgi:tetrahydromethanopterin S-methyltransferase subunit G
MEESKLNVTLKVYLDEKFENMEKRFDIIDQKVNLLDSKISQEHDKILSLEKDVSYFTSELHSVKKEHKECLENCTRRKADIDDRISALLEPRIKEAVANLRIWIISTAATALLALVAYLVINFFIPAVKNTEQPTKRVMHSTTSEVLNENTKNETGKPAKK